MPPRFRHCSTTWSSATRRWCGCSSSTAPRRSAAPLAGTRRSNAAKGPHHCRASAQGGAGQGLSGRPGRWRRAEQRIRNLARRLDKEWPGIAATILEGLDGPKGTRSGQILCVLPKELRRSLACTNIIENMNGTIRQVTRNVKRWRDASMALRWTAAGMMEAKKGFRRLMAYKQLPTLKAALLAHQAARLAPATSDSALACTGEAA
jgi:hypothetical protein